MADFLKRRSHVVFFVLAALQAVVIVPLAAIRAVTGDAATIWPLGAWPLVGWSGGAWHAHEMIFGFALCVMGGYFSGKYSSRQTALLIASWVLARAVMFNPNPAWTPLAGLYPLLLFFFAGLPMLRAAKTLRNVVFGLVLAGIAVVETALLVSSFIVPDFSGWNFGRVGLLLILIMIFTMGGRITAAATSGAHQAAGRTLPRAAQISLERAGLYCLVALACLLAGGFSDLLVSVVSAGVSVIVGLRLWHWQFWKLRDPAVLCLHLGFGWLCGGFLLIALEPLFSGPNLTDIFHALTIGAVGTFALVVMTRVTLQKARQPIILSPIIYSAIAGINLAAVARIAASTSQHSNTLLVSAAILWVLGWCLFLVSSWPHLRR